MVEEKRLWRELHKILDGIERERRLWRELHEILDGIEEELN